jgi:hypothetical protein
MGTRNDIDGLLRFIGRDTVWRDRLSDVMDEHLMPALEEFDIAADDLEDILGAPWPNVLLGCGFEDFLGRRYGRKGQNVVDLYLKRQGWTESAQNRAYLEGLRDAPASLYEVTKVRPGDSMVLRDLMSKGDPVTVREKSATRSLKTWDKIAVRVVQQQDHHVISGALLAFSPEAVELLQDGLRHVLKLRGNQKINLAAEQLREIAPLFTNAWLFSALPRALNPEPPQITNSDREDLMFHDLRFAFAPRVLQKDVAARLGAVKALVPEGARFWNWIAKSRRSGASQVGGLMLEAAMQGGTVLGSLEMKGKALFLSVNSAERAERGEDLIMKAAGDLLKPPLTTIRTVAQMMEEEYSEPEEQGADEIPPEISRQIIHRQMDSHYRETLDAPVPALGGKTPRQAVRSAAGRRKVIEWLKQIENRSAKQSDSPMAEYDFGWMWEELGVVAERH